MGKRKCSVEGCQSESNKPEHLGVTFHKVPQKPDIRPRWLKACHITDDKDLHFICSRHFLRADFCNYKGTKYVLRQGILPSVFPWNRGVKKPSPKEKPKPNDVKASVKRIRKKKLNPDYVTEDDMKKREGKMSDDGERLIVESEDSTSEGSLPPILEPENVANVKSPIENIPKLEPLEGKQTDKSSKIKVNKLKKKKLLQTEHETPTTSIIKDKIIVEDKCSPSEIKTHESIFERAKVKEKPTEELPTISEPCKPQVNENQPMTTIENKMEGSANTSSSGQLNFEPNSRIEALDFNQTWSPATILEVDYEENEVLVHFDSYSSKYDEWIGINSASIRAPSDGKKEESETEASADEKVAFEGVRYEVGERCIAYWIDAKKFPGVVKEVVNHDTYVVEFDDGYIKTMNASKMIKTSTSIQNSPLFMPSTNTKEERRNKKRRLNVQSLFKKRSKKSHGSAAGGRSADDSASKSGDSGYYGNDNMWYPNFENGVPLGTPSQLKTKTGMKGSIMVNDPLIPDGWEKHALQREGGKWFSLIVTSNGRKLRCRADIQRYTLEHPEFNLDDYILNFYITPRRRASQLNASQDKTDAEMASTPPPSSPPRNEPQLKILQVDGGYQCPIEGCGKNFRRENLVQMHVKHYHPEFKKYLESTPNVLDLVYQRLHGDEFELSPSRSTSDYVKKLAAPIDEITNTNANDALLYEPKDTEIKKLLSSPFDCSETGSQSSTASTSAGDNKMQEVIDAVAAGPDLKSLAVTTKTGLRTIPPLKKPMGDDGERKEGAKKRRIEEIITDQETQSSDSGLLGEHEFVLQPPAPILDHIIGEDGKVIKIEHMRKEEIINCTCGVTEEDGLMIQCEICMCWQHAHCNNIYRETEVPDKYICYICENPVGQRTSKKYVHDQDWLKHGALPTASYHYRDEEAYQKRFEQLRTSHDLSGGLLELKDFMHTLKLKIKIAELKNHPKLYLWSKPWDKTELPENRPKAKLEDDKEDVKPKEEDSIFGKQSNAPQPEAAIETADCRLNLLEHIDHCQSLIEQRLDDFEKKIDALGVKLLAPVESDDVVRLATSMLVRDLGTLKEFSQMTTF